MNLIIIIISFRMEDGNVIDDCDKGCSSSRNFMDLESLELIDNSKAGQEISLSLERYIIKKVI